MKYHLKPVGDLSAEKIKAGSIPVFILRPVKLASIPAAEAFHRHFEFALEHQVSISRYM